MSTIASKPQWLVASSSSGVGVTWGIVGTDGDRSIFGVANGNLSRVQKLSAEEDFSLAAPVLAPLKNGELHLLRRATGEPDGPPVGAGMSKIETLPDGQTVLDDDERLYSYDEPVGRYPYGALGDQIEWGALRGGPIHNVRETDRYRLTADEVFEGLFPLLADFDGDGQVEIVTTVSNSDDGSRLVLFGYDDKGYA